MPDVLSGGAPPPEPQNATPKLSWINLEDNHLKAIAKCPAKPKESGAPDAWEGL